MGHQWWLFEAGSMDIHILLCDKWAQWAREKARVNGRSGEKNAFVVNHNIHVKKSVFATILNHIVQELLVCEHFLLNPRSQVSVRMSAKKNDSIFSCFSFTLVGLAVGLVHVPVSYR